MIDSELSTRSRLLIALGAASIAAGYLVWFAYSTHQFSAGGSDFDQLWFASRALWHGVDPYTQIGPGRVFDWPWPLVYPLTTVVAVTPFIVLPLFVARMCFVALSAGALTYALLTWRGTAVLPLLASAAVLDALRAAQLSPLLTAGLLLPWAAIAIAVKPHIGFPLLAASPRTKSVIIALSVMALLTIVAFLAQPSWIQSWRRALAGAGHVRVPVFALGGPLMLLALVKWRRFDARVLLACALVPHTPVVYDVVPISLIARDFRESTAFALLTYVALFAQDRLVPNHPPAQAATLAATILNFAIYLPALVAVLLRPNESEGAVRDGLLSPLTAGRRASAEADLVES